MARLYPKMGARGASVLPGCGMGEVTSVRRLLAPCCLWLASLGAGACAEEARPPARAPAAPAPQPQRRDAGGALEAEVLRQLERDVNVILAGSCGACHSWSARLLVRVDSSCREGGPLVVPGAPERSPLYGKVSGTPQCGGAMPPTGRLAPPAIESLRAWILAGAPVEGQRTPSAPDAGPGTEPRRLRRFEFDSSMN